MKKLSGLVLMVVRFYKDDIVKLLDSAFDEADEIAKRTDNTLDDKSVKYAREYVINIVDGL